MVFGGMVKGLKAWLFPQEKRFFVLFNDQATLMVESAKALVEMIGNFDKLKQRRDKIKDLENKGDDILKEIYALSNLSFITPLDHEDIIALAQANDDVIDYIYAVANRILLYDLKKVTPEMKQFATIIAASTEMLAEGINRIQKLSPDDAEKIYHDTNNMEREGDDLLNQTVGKLLKSKDMLYIIKQKEIHEHLELVTDKLHVVGCVLLDTAIKYS